jgi:hypothetical protein
MTDQFLPICAYLISTFYFLDKFFETKNKWAAAFFLVQMLFWIYLTTFTIVVTYFHN